MTDWKPKFKEGDVVASPYTGIHFRVPKEYVWGDERFRAERESGGLWEFFDQEFFDHKMDLVHSAPPTAPSATQPNYYRFEVRGVAVDIIDVIQGLGLGCEAGNVYKYLARAGKKDASKHIEDLEKAREWLDRLIEFRRRS